jgi:hypothetical protein
LWAIAPMQVHNEISHTRGHTRRIHQVGSPFPQSGATAVSRSRPNVNRIRILARWHIRAFTIPGKKRNA